MAGGLLSAHLFAVGDLPVRGYSPPEEEREFAAAWNKSGFPPDRHGIVWPNGLVYDGQLLRLAKDLGDRLLPVFYTETGIPYPRVNLRYGIPFYKNSPLNAWRTEKDDSRASRHANPVQPEVEDEATDTSSAGAGSLVLEFTTLSRLTGDGRYEEHAKRAFWAVWNRRSDVGLLATTIDVESGKWLTPYTWVSFFFVSSDSVEVELTRYRLAQGSIAFLNTHSSHIYSCLSGNGRPSIPKVHTACWIIFTSRSTRCFIRPMRSSAPGRKPKPRSSGISTAVKGINIPILFKATSGPARRERFGSIA